MSRFPRPLRRQSAEESGMSLIELLVAMPLALLLMFAALTFSDLTLRNQQKTTDRAEQTEQAKVGLERMTRELRQASYFKLLTSQVAEAATYVRSAGVSQTFDQGLRLVRYDCSQADECRRFEGPPGGPLSSNATVLYRNVENDDIFDPSPDFLDPGYITLKISIGVLGSDTPITLKDGIDLRNRSAGSSQ